MKPALRRHAALLTRREATGSTVTAGGRLRRGGQDDQIIEWHDRVLEGGCGEAHPDMPWEPKLASTALANYYRS